MSPSTPRISAVTSRCVPPRYSGKARMAVAILASGPSAAAASRPNERASARQRHGVDRGAAAVDGDGARLGAGELAHGVGDGHLERVGRVAVGREVPPVDDARREHRGVLAGAVLHDGLLGPAARDPPDPRRLVVGVVGGVLQVGLGQARAGEDLAGRLDVEVLAGVARARERQEAAVGRRGRCAPSRAPAAACSSCGGRRVRSSRRSRARPSRRER